MDKRKFGKLATTGLLSAIYGASIVAAYREQGKEPVVNDMERVKRVAFAASVMTALTWFAASL